MDGLLRSEFALVLRDSLNSTPRRHVLPPTTPPIPSPPKKPRVTDVTMRCNMQLEPRLSFAPMPTSPTSPLPSSNLLQSPMSVPPFKTEPRMLPVDNLALLSAAAPDTNPHTTHRSTTHKRKRDPHTLPIGPRPLDVLATVSELQLRPEPHAPPSRTLFPPSPARVLMNGLPSSPVNSTPVTPVADEKKKPRSRTSRANNALSKSNSSGRTFACAQCPSTFSQQFNLNKHVRAVHERRRPFECETCHAKFQQKSHRTMHNLAVHEKLRQFGCDQCNASFSWRGVLKKHRKSIHGLDD